MAVVQPKIGQPGVQAPSYADKGGIVSWLTTTDHKKIGIMYIVSAFVFFLIGGIEALLMRVQLSVPNNTFLTADVYNQLVTMHGTTMIFLFVMPMNVGLANYIVPLMLGARDMAFPRLNALSIWCFMLGGLMLYVSFVAGGAPNVGWFAYAPLTQKIYAPTHGVDYWIWGLLLTGVASIAGAVNFIVTILNMRAPGMTLNRMPLFAWMTLIVAFILIWAFPTLTVAQFQLYFDRNWGTGFYVTERGGDAVLWMHLFWFFGHPEVYILILPTMGIVSEVLPTYSRKPIFGYAFVAYSGVAIGFLGFLVWVHHMFAVGIGPLANAFFSAASFLVAIPTGVKIFNWIATLWGGSIQLTTSMKFALAFISMFIIGGISGITLASPPINLQQTDSYYVVAHFHYVLFGGAVLGIFSGLYYWFPKISGRMLSERLGNWNFWTLLIGFNLTFFPMHIAGTDGMPRRVYTWESGMGWELWNMLETVGAFLTAASVLLFMWNVIVSLRAGQRAPNDPWDGSSLEWATSSPPPVYNFASLPVVHSRRPLWDTKYPELNHDEEDTDPQPPADAHAGHGDHIHLPSPTYAPLIVSIGVAVLAFAAIYTPLIAPIGLVIMGVGIVIWVRSNHKDAPVVSH